MSLRASLSVILGCNFSSANRLLSAAERGDEAAVRQVLRDKPQLSAFCGFHGTTSPLHRAAAAGHLGVCRAIIEPLKQRCGAGDAAAGLPAGGAGGAAASKWHRLLATVLNQRSHKSLTPLMAACEHGHAAVAAYLLREGADPLAADFVHSRTCLHYAAVGGHADCLRLLCSDTAMVPSADGARPLRDVIVSDVQVQACRFIDQRAFGGLTALHFAVVTGSLDAVQALLRAGASIMVKSDGEAYIGEDFLVPGSTPLHVAVIIQNLSIVHAILQAHTEMMNILGTQLDERGRRPWEGTSRTDIRSVRNHFRKLPFHLARERHQAQLMSLVDPRIPIDVALDAARDTEHGIGPKRLGTICSLVLQRSLMHWLDDCQSELAREAAAKAAEAAAAEAALQQRSPGSSIGQAALAPLTGRPPKPGSQTPSARSSVEAGAAAAAASGAAAVPVAAAEQLAAQEEPPLSPFAELAAQPELEARPRPLHMSASAPVTPALPQQAGQAGGAQPPAQLPASDGAVPALEATVAAAAEAGGTEPGPSGDPMQRMASLHGYMGLLSLKRPQSTRSMDALRGMQASQARPSGGRAMSRQLSGSVTPLARSSSSTPPLAAQTARVRFLSDPNGGGAEGLEGAAEQPGSVPESPRDLGITAAGGAPSPLSEAAGGGAAGAAGPLITVMHRRSSSQGNPRLGVFTGLRERLRSSEALPPASDLIAAARAPGGGGALLPGEKPTHSSEKDLGLDSEGEAGSPSAASSAEEEDMECGVCLDAVVEVAFAACQHKLCLECARNLTRQNKKPPHCPFCRRLVVGFQRVSATGALLGDACSSRATSPMHPLARMVR